MHPADITAALKKRKSSQKSIATAHGVSPAVVSMVISGNARSRRLEAAIAAATGHPVSRLWPKYARANTPATATR